MSEQLVRRLENWAYRYEELTLILGWIAMIALIYAAYAATSVSPIMVHGDTCPNIANLYCSGTIWSTDPASYILFAGGVINVLGWTMFWEQEVRQ